MKIFKKFNPNGIDVCPICGTKEEKEVTLIPIQGTEKDGAWEAIQVHVDCINLIYDKKMEIFYQVVKEAK